MTSIPLIPTLVLGILSLLSSTFTLLCILVPILPPRYLLRNLAARKATWEQLSAAHKAIVWLTLFDVLALVIFIIQVFQQFRQHSTAFDGAMHGSSAARFWISLTARQTALFVVLSITLLHVRLGRPVSFGPKHMFFWIPSLGFVLTGAIAAGVLADFGFYSLFPSLGTYLTVVALLATTLLASLAVTIWRIKRSLQTGKDVSSTDSWLDFSNHKRRQSFSTDDVEALKDGSSWITSTNGSERRSMSPWSFTTTNTINTTTTRSTSTRHRSRHSIPNSLRGQITNSICSENYNYSHGVVDEEIPPVPPLPPLYNKAFTYEKEANLPQQLPKPSPRIRDRQRPPREDSIDSWLTSISDSRETMSSFSFPTTHYSQPSSRRGNVNASRSTVHLKEPTLPTLAGTTTLHPSVPPQVTFKSIDQSNDTENSAFYSLDLTKPSSDRQMTLTRLIGWLATIWIPYSLSMPYILLANPNHGHSSSVSGVLLIISITISSPLLAIILLLKTPFHMPLRLFSEISRSYRVSQSAHLPQHCRSQSLQNFDSRRYHYGKSSSHTVVEGRRSGDVWIEKGQAVDMPSRVGRMASLLIPHPKLSVLPLRDQNIAVHFPSSTDLTFDDTVNLSGTPAPDITLETDQAPGGDDGMENPVSYTERQVQLNPNTSEQSINSRRHNRLALVKSRRYSPPNFKKLKPQTNQPSTITKASPSPPAINSSPSQHSNTSNKIDGLSAVILPILVPGLVVGDAQPIEPIESFQQTEGPSQAFSDLLEKAKNTGSRVKSLKRTKKRFRRSLNLNAPDGHSTPYHRNSKHNMRGIRSIRNNLSPLQAKKDDSNTQSNQHLSYGEISLPYSLQAAMVTASDEDSLTRKMNSLIQALGSPGATSTPHTPHEGIGGFKYKEPTSTVHFPTQHDASPVKPLDLSKMGVARHKPKPHRFSPFKKSRKGQPPTQDSDFTVGKYSGMGCEPLQSTDCGEQQDHTLQSASRYCPDDQAPPPPPSGYLPVIGRFSALFPQNNTAYDAKDQYDDAGGPSKGHDTVQRLSESSNRRPLTVAAGSGYAGNSEQSSRTMVPVGIFKKADNLRGNKENKPVTSRPRKDVSVAMSDTAKARSLLMRKQQPPIVVVHPPSTGPNPLQVNNGKDNSNSDFLSRQCI